MSNGFATVAQHFRDLAEVFDNLSEDARRSAERTKADALAKLGEPFKQNLINGLVDLIFIDRYVAKNIIVKKFPWHLQDYEFMQPPLANKPLYIGFSKKAAGHQKMLASTRCTEPHEKKIIARNTQNTRGMSTSRFRATK